MDQCFEEGEFEGVNLPLRCFHLSRKLFATSDGAKNEPRTNPKNLVSKAFTEPWEKPLKYCVLESFWGHRAVGTLAGKILGGFVSLVLSI